MTIIPGSLENMAYTPLDIPIVVYIIATKNDTFGASTHLIFLD